MKYNDIIIRKDCSYCKPVTSYVSRHPNSAITPAFIDLATGSGLPLTGIRNLKTPSSYRSMKYKHRLGFEHLYRQSRISDDIISIIIEYFPI